MPRLFSSPRLTTAITATLATGAVAIVPASAETRIETVLGTGHTAQRDNGGQQRCAPSCP